MQDQDSQMVVRRFFEALDHLKEKKIIRGRATFCNKCKINRRNLYQLEQDPSRDILKAAWLTYLVRDFGVSAQWLLTGEGPMMKKPLGRPKGS